MLILNNTFCLWEMQFSSSLKYDNLFEIKNVIYKFFSKSKLLSTHLCTLSILVLLQLLSLRIMLAFKTKNTFSIRRIRTDQWVPCCDRHSPWTTWRDIWDRLRIGWVNGVKHFSFYMKQYYFSDN